MGKKSSYVKKGSLSKEEQRVVRETLAGKKNISPVKEPKQGIQKIGIAPRAPSIKGKIEKLPGRKSDYGKYKIQTLPGNKRDYDKTEIFLLKNKSSPVIKKMSGK